MSKVTVDDTSSRIKYTGYWEEGEDNNNTVHSAWDPRSEAIFSFRGTHVAVYGIVPDGDGEVVRVDFSVDNGTAASETRRSGERKIMNELWWESDSLPDGEHTLVMTYLPNGVDMDFRLDFIEYTPSGDSSGSSPPVQGSGTTATDTTTTTATQFLTPTSDGSTGGTSSSSEKGAPVGAIVGGVLGGLVLLVLIALAYLLLRRRRRKLQATSAAEEDPVSPFPVPTQGEPSAASTTKPRMSQSALRIAAAAPEPPVASPVVSSSSKSGLSYAQSESTAAAVPPSEPPPHSTRPLSERDDHDPPPPAYEDHV